MSINDEGVVIPSEVEDSRSDTRTRVFLLPLRTVSDHPTDCAQDKANLSE
jgi:hypothetical protein